MTLSLVAALALAAASAPPEPAPEPRRPVTGGSFVLMVGGLQPDLSDLSAAMRDAGRPRLPRQFVTLGAGFLGRTQRLLFGAEGHLVPGRGVRDADLDLEVSGSFLLGELGVVIVDGGPLTLFALLGAGGGDLSVRFSPRDAPSIGAFLADPRRGGTLDAGGFLLQPAVGLDFLPGGGERSVFGLTMGLRAGFLWRTDRGLSLAGKELAGGVDAGLTGPFVRLAVGFGGVSR